MPGYHITTAGTGKPHSARCVAQPGNCRVSGSIPHFPSQDVAEMWLETHPDEVKSMTNTAQVRLKSMSREELLATGTPSTPRRKRNNVGLLMATRGAVGWRRSY